MEGRRPGNPALRAVKLRVSLGTLAVLGLTRIRMEAKPTTAYLLQYSEDGCHASCSFCPQGSENVRRREYVSRIPWPAMDAEFIIKSLAEREGEFSRICIQSVLKPGFSRELVDLVRAMRGEGIATPISVATTPVPVSVLEELKDLKVDHLGIGLDAASQRIFSQVKSPFSWEFFWEFVRQSIRVFGRGKVVVHLIFGLGETEEEFLRTLRELYNIGASVALFAFTPVQGTRMEDRSPPQFGKYRLAQLARYLIERGENEVRRSLKEVIGILPGNLEKVKEAFLTSGCPGCNRPFYNEKPSAPYNYPSIEILERDFLRIKRQIGELRW